MDLVRDRDVISGMALAALGVLVVSNALQWTYLGPDGPGPGFFPAWYGGLMIALSLYLVVKAVIRPDPAARTAIDWRGTGRALAAWGLIAGSIALLEPLGFAVAFALLALGIIRLVMGRPLVVALATAVPMAAAFWIVFGLALGINLPAGTAWTPLARALGIG